MITISLETDPNLETPEENLSGQIVETVLEQEKVFDADINLIFGDDALLNKLKNEFFKLDQLTDVIAFRLNDYDHAAVEGEIYISLPRAKENAKNFDEPFNREVARLIIHGTLHLLNYKDDTEEEKIQMRQKENETLNHVNWKYLF